jgi:hypothetical protein
MSRCAGQDDFCLTNGEALVGSPCRLPKIRRVTSREWQTFLREHH